MKCKQSGNQRGASFITEVYCGPQLADTGIPTTQVQEWGTHVFLCDVTVQKLGEPKHVAKSVFSEPTSIVFDDCAWLYFRQKLKVSQDRLENVCCCEMHSS